jgi:hypothetical protein
MYLIKTLSCVFVFCCRAEKNLKSCDKNSRCSETQETAYSVQKESFFVVFSSFSRIFLLGLTSPPLTYPFDATPSERTCDAMEPTSSQSFRMFRQTVPALAIVKKFELDYVGAVVKENSTGTLFSKQFKKCDRKDVRRIQL